MSSLAVLCVDDEKLVLDSLKDELESMVIEQGLILETAESGEEAVEVFEENLRDGIETAVIIADQIMPKMKGDELLIDLHKRSPYTLNILLTGQAEAISVGNIINNASLYRYISKPWHPMDLRLTVLESIKKYKIDCELEEQRALIEDLKVNVVESFINYEEVELSDEELYNKVFFTRFLNSLDPVSLKWVTDATMGLICADNKITRVELVYVNALVNANKSSARVHHIVNTIREKEPPTMDILKVSNQMAYKILDRLIGLVVSGGKLSKQEAKYLIFLGGKLGIDKQPTQMLLDHAQEEIQAKLKKQKLLNSVKNIPLVYKAYS